jgi:hypothetical protein
VTNKPWSRRGEHETDRKPLCRECRLTPVNLWRLPRVFYTGPRVHRTPGIPCALFLEGRRFSSTNSGAMRGENAEVCPPVMPAQAGIQYSETPVIESKTRGVLDTRLRGYEEW